MIVAAEVITSGNERSRLEPMVDPTIDELAAAGVSEQRAVVLADAGFFNLGQIDALRQRGFRPLFSPDASGRSEPGLTRRKPAYEQMRKDIVSDDGHELYRRLAQPSSSPSLPYEDLAPRGPLPETRLTRSPGGMAPDHRHAQPSQALAAHQPAAPGLTAGASGPRRPLDRAPFTSRNLAAAALRDSLA